MIEPGEAATAVAVELLEKWKAERQRLDKIDRWLRWDHDDPHSPRHSTNEYRELSARAQAPWGDLIVSSVAQTLYVEGYRRPKAPEDSDGWDIWQANGMDARQVAIFRASLGYGAAYGTVLPGRTLAGESMPQMRGVSPREMVAFYEDPAWDDWPVYALRVRRKGPGFDLTLFDDTYVHQLRVSDLSDRPIYVGERPAGGGVLAAGDLGDLADPGVGEHRQQGAARAARVHGDADRPPLLDHPGELLGNPAGSPAGLHDLEPPLAVGAVAGNADRRPPPVR